MERTGERRGETRGRGAYSEEVYERGKRSREDDGRDDWRGGGGVKRSVRVGERGGFRSGGDFRSMSRSRSRSREIERERVGKEAEDGERKGERRRRSSFEYDSDDWRTEKRRRYHRELDSSRHYHGSRGGRDRQWIGRVDYDRRERFVAPSRDRDREGERSHVGKERIKDGVEDSKVELENGQNGDNEEEEKARTYQLEVLAQAKMKNTIAFLETGAGKTLIAVLLMKHKYQVLREQGRRMLAVFLVPKVPLVYQVL